MFKDAKLLEINKSNINWKKKLMKKRKKLLLPSVI